MIIRPAQQKDVSLVARCIIMAEGDVIPMLTGFGDPLLAEEKLSGWITSPTSNRYSLEHALVAETGGRAVAALLGFPADDQPNLDAIIIDDLRRRGRDLTLLLFEGIPATYYLSIMGVEPECRGQGVGTALMTAAQEAAKAEGFTHASLLVEQDRERVGAMYGRLGFHVVGEVTLASFKYWRMLREL